MEYENLSKKVTENVLENIETKATINEVKERIIKEVLEENKREREKSKNKFVTLVLPVMATIAVPVIIAYYASEINSTISENTLKKDYLALGITLNSLKDIPENKKLKSVGLSLINKFLPSDIDPITADDANTNAWKELTEKILRETSIRSNYEFSPITGSKIWWKGDPNVNRIVDIQEQVAGKWVTIFGRSTSGNRIEGINSLRENVRWKVTLESLGMKAHEASPWVYPNNK